MNDNFFCIWTWQQSTLWTYILEERNQPLKFQFHIQKVEIAEAYKMQVWLYISRYRFIDDDQIFALSHKIPSSFHIICWNRTSMLQSASITSDCMAKRAKQKYFENIHVDLLRRSNKNNFMKEDLSNEFVAYETECNEKIRI